VRICARKVTHPTFAAVDDDYDHTTCAAPERSPDGRPSGRCESPSDPRPSAVRRATQDSLFKKLAFSLNRWTVGDYVNTVDYRDAGRVSSESHHLEEQCCYVID
jgi:hypothetical protein